MSEKKYEYSYSGQVAKITESNALQVRLQDGNIKKLAIWSLYEKDGEWNYRSPKAGGAVAINIPVMTSQVVAWIISELTKVQVMMEKEEKATVKKTPTAKTASADVDFTKPTATTKAKKEAAVSNDDDIVLELYKANKATNKKKK